VARPQGGVAMSRDALVTALAMLAAMLTWAVALALLS
jgi:hypothetical protein